MTLAPASRCPPRWHVAEEAGTFACQPWSWSLAEAFGQPSAWPAGPARLAQEGVNSIALVPVQVLPLYCFDPRSFGTTPFGNPKTGSLRAKFLLDSVQDLKANLR